jgi:glycosyltransferase involved in cell wall biosynthesis
MTSATAAPPPLSEQVTVTRSRILYDARWFGYQGIGRFAEEVGAALPSLTPFTDSRPPSGALDPIFLSAMLWKERPRLFFSPGYNSPAISAVPFVFTLHDLHHLCVPDNSNALKRAFYRYLIRPACHRAACVLTVSDYSKSEIVEWAKVSEDKIVNVGNGVGRPFYPTGPVYRPGYPYLLYVGSRKPHKNLPRLLEAFALSGVGRDVRLVLSGEPDGALAAKAAQLGLGEGVQFVPAPTTEKLAELYRGALAFVFVSYYEGFGLPPLESMACGTPVLTSKVCSLPEVTGDAALLIDPYNVEEIAGQIRRLVEDSSLRHDLKERGLVRAAKYSWMETAQKIQSVLNAVLEAS